MLSEEVIDKVVERLVKRIEQGNEYILQKIGESVKKIGTLSQSEAEELKVMIMYGGDYDKIINRLSKITNINESEIHEIFDEVAKKEYGNAEKFFEYKDLNYIPYEETALKNQVDALAKITADTYKNFSNTSLIGFNGFDEAGNLVFKDLKETYIDIMDQAILNVGQGKQTFDEAMYDTLSQLAKSNLQTVEYENTYIDKDGNERHYTRSLDSTVRMNLKDGLMNLHNTIQEEVGREFKADGVEITVHSLPAPDHADAQGRQFSINQYDENGKLIKEGEFEKLQSTGHAKDYKGHEVDMRRTSKKGRTSFRPISQYNCYHTVYSIVLGVNKPQYSNDELKQMADESNSKINFGDKSYTKYQCTQLQRRLELEIRKSKNEQIIGRASDNTELIEKSQKRITNLTKRYRELSSISKLPEYTERMRVSGYKRTTVRNDKFKNIVVATHITKAENVKSIEQEGFDLGKANSGAGNTYGKGAYFSTKQNEIDYWKWRIDNNKEIKASIDTTDFLKVTYNNYTSGNNFVEPVIEQFKDNEKKQYEKLVKQYKEENKIANQLYDANNPDYKKYWHINEKQDAMNKILESNYPGLIIEQTMPEIDIIVGGNQIVVYDLKRIKKIYKKTKK